MRIKEIRTRVVSWRGKTVPLPPHFCTNPMDLLTLPEASMATFTFHGWLVVEIFTDDGHVGIGNAALVPHVTKQVIDLYLKPLLIGQDPWDTDFLWQHMYRKTMAFGRKGIGMVAISAVDIALWDLLGKSARQPVYRLLGGRTKPRIPVYASRLYSVPLNELAAEAKRYKDEGYKAMKLRFGWGPTDGARGIERGARRRERAPIVGRRVGLRRPQAGAHRLRRHDHLGQPLAHMRQAHGVAGLGDSRRQPEQELALDHVLDHHLMHHVDDRVGGPVHRVASIHVAADKNVFHRHRSRGRREDDAVHLVEARGERMVEARAPDIERVAAEKPEPRRGVRTGHREGERERLRGGLGLEHGRTGTPGFAPRAGPSCASIRHPLDHDSGSLVQSISLSARSASVWPGPSCGAARWRGFTRVCVAHQSWRRAS